jgi:hypothetical protein
MNINDPIKKAEGLIHETHDTVGRYTKPVLSRYPLLFSFLTVFSIAAILDGFRMWSEQIHLFEEHPSYLMAIGIIALFLTGTLYKSLEKMR